MTRIAVIADVHGNAPALDAVLAEIERESPDLVILADDARDYWDAENAASQLLDPPDPREMEELDESWRLQRSSS